MRRVHDAGASSFLYPFLDEREDDLEAVVEDVRRSVLMKAGEVGALREQTLTDNAQVLVDAAGALRASFEHGGKLLALGNGGSATDAMDVVADFRARRPSRDRSDRGHRDPDRDRERHRRRGDLLAPGHRLRRRRRHVAGAVDVGQLGQRDPRTGRGAATGSRDDRDGRLRRRPDRERGSRRARRDQPLRAHPPDPGGPGERVSRVAGAGGMNVQAPARGRRRTRVRVDGTVQGVGFRPYVYRLAGELGLGGFVLNDARGVLIEVEGSPASVDRFLVRLGAEAPPLAVVERVVVRGARGQRGPRRSRSGRASAAKRPTRRSRPTPRPATTACASCSTRPTAASATRSSTARTAGRGSRSSAASPTTGR